MPSGRTNNYPESGRGLGHVTPTIFGIRSNISLKILELETSNLIHGFVWAMPSRRVNNFPESRRGLVHLNFTIFGSTVGYPSDSLALLVTMRYMTLAVMTTCTVSHYRADYVCPI